MKNNKSNLNPLKLKSIFTHFFSHFDKITTKFHLNKEQIIDTDDYLKWSILKKKFLKKSLDLEEKELLLDVFQYLRNYNSHYWYEGTECLKKIPKLFGLLYKGENYSEFPNLNSLNKLFERLLEKKDDLVEKSCLMLFYSSIILYKGEYYILKNLISQFFEKDKILKKNFKKYCEEFDALKIKIDKTKFVDWVDDDKTKFVFSSLQMLGYVKGKQEKKNDDKKSNEQILASIEKGLSLRWIVEFWNFLLDDETKKYIDLKLKRLYYCENCKDQELNREKKWKKVTCEDVKGKFTCQGEKHSKENRRISCQKKCKLTKYHRNYFYCFEDNEYWIFKNVFKFKVHGLHFVISSKSARHFLLLMLFKVYSKENYFHALKIEFKRFLDDNCTMENSDYFSIKNFVEHLKCNLDKKNIDQWSDNFWNRTYIKKYYFQGLKNGILFTPYVLDQDYSINDFYRNRREFKIQKLKNFEKNLKESNIQINYRDYDLFPKLVEKLHNKNLHTKENKMYFEEIRIRLRFVFSYLNSSFLKSKLDSIDFNYLFAKSFQELTKKKNSFNVFTIIKEIIQNSKKPEVKTLWNTIPEEYHKFDVQNFDACFQEIIQKKIELLEKNEDKENFDNSFYHSVLKIKKTDQFKGNELVKSIKINHHWLANSGFKKQKLQTIFNEIKPNSEILKIFHSKFEKNQDVVKYIDLFAKEYFSLRFTLLLEFFLIKVFKDWWLKIGRKTETPNIKVCLNEENFLKSKIKFFVKNPENQKKWIIVFDGFGKFYIDKLKLHKLDEWKTVEQIITGNDWELNEINFNTLVRKQDQVLFKKIDFPDLSKDVSVFYGKLICQFLKYEKWEIEKKDKRDIENLKQTNKVCGDEFIPFSSKLFSKDLRFARNALFHRDLTFKGKGIIFQHLKEYLIYCSNLKNN